MCDLLVKSFDHTFLVHLTMTNNREPFLVNEVQLVKSSLNPFILFYTFIFHDSQGKGLDFDG